MPDLENVTLSIAAFLSYQERGNKFTMLMSELGIEFERFDRRVITLQEFHDRIRNLYQRL